MVDSCENMVFLSSLISTFCRLMVLTDYCLYFSNSSSSAANLESFSRRYCSSSFCKLYLTCSNSFCKLYLTCSSSFCKFALTLSFSSFTCWIWLWCRVYISSLSLRHPSSFWYYLYFSFSRSSYNELILSINSL